MHLIKTFLDRRKDQKLDVLAGPRHINICITRLSDNFGMGFSLNPEDFGDLAKALWDASPKPLTILSTPLTNGQKENELVQAVRGEGE